jgi:hypothetical protein
MPYSAAGEVHVLFGRQWKKENGGGGFSDTIWSFLEIELFEGIDPNWRWGLQVYILVVFQLESY